MLELWQTEWCPASRRIRRRLTELGIDHVTRQVPVERQERVAFRQTAGTDIIPTLLLEDGSALIGERAILAHLDELPDAEAHRLNAARSRRRYLEEECECLQPATH